MKNSKHSNYNNENIETKYVNNIRKTRFLKVKNSLLELKKDFIELKDRELKDIEVKIKREIDELFIKPIVVSVDDMGKFEQKEMKKKIPIKNTWYDWLINYISKPIRKSAGGFKDKVNKPCTGEERNQIHKISLKKTQLKTSEIFLN